MPRPSLPLLALLATRIALGAPEATLADPPFEEEPAHGRPLTVDEVVLAALQGSEEVLEAEARVLEARARRAEASGLPGNPIVEGALGLDGETFGLEARQPVSVLGEGRLAHRAARAEVEAAEYQLLRTRFEVAVRARRAWLEAVTRRRLVDLETRSAELALALRDAVARQVELGEAPLLSLRLARLAAASAAVEQLEAQGAEARALQDLAALVRRPVTRDDLPTEAAGAAPPSSNLAAYGRSDVRAAFAAVTAAEAELARQRAAVLPPVEIGAFVESDGEGTLVGPAFEMALPVFHRNQVGRASARGALHVARTRARATSARQATEASTASARVGHAEALAASMGDDLEAEAYAALASIESGYALGELGLTEALTLRDQVLAGLRALLRLEQELAEARLDLLLAVEDRALLPGFSAESPRTP